jgi:hypothetical protein
MDKMCPILVDMRNAFKILAGKPERKRQLENSGVHGKMILKWLLNLKGVKTRTEFIWLRRRVPIRYVVNRVLF